MRKKTNKQIERCRVKKGMMATTKEHGLNGVFTIPYKRHVLTVIVSNQLGWDHVSVSTKGRVPTWYEMQYIKDLFFEPEETAVQYHPKKSSYINIHPHVLHIWRKQGQEIELPPVIMV